MSINKQRLDLALSTIQMDEEGYFSSGKYVDLIGNIHVNAALRPELGQLSRCFSIIQQDIKNIKNIILRLDWQMSLLKRNELDEVLWMDFTACDIDHFHVEIRSFFDSLAKAISLVSNHPDQVPNRSFRKLKDWVEKNENENTIGMDLAAIIRSCEWFDDFKKIRELLIHHGGYTIVFLVPDRITFQVHKGWKNEVLIPEIMYNKNIVDFELYAGLYTGYLMAYLEEISEIFNKRLNLQELGSNSKSYHPGLIVIQNWIGKVNSL